ncbi:CBU_0592 family membrane protein [Mycetocola spongiae]|uniref:CBU_0592 family membrane protein n=1 Tax=Mycetocola spongiae TaxID=2859226 RepID=UPI001CF0E3E1|nr:hypothetical protein [Mycetocola spongiae]UCR88632.1 hypothetical protein KXZ72_11790 [Mycetocola spongiae]
MEISALVVAAGWIGAVCTVLAYGLLSAGKLGPESMFFQIANVVGAGLLLISAATNGAWPSAVVNGIWILIGAHAVFGLARSLRRRRSEALAAQTSFAGSEFNSESFEAEAEYVELAPTLIMPVITADMIAEAREERRLDVSADTGRLSLAG